MKEKKLLIKNKLGLHARAAAKIVTLTNKFHSDIKIKRDNKKVKQKLLNIQSACEGNENIVPLIIDAVLEYATLGEIVDCMKEIYGEWTENSVI